MKILFFISVYVLVFNIKLFAQPCGVVQNLSSTQQSQLGIIRSALDTALKYEDLNKIDSLSNGLKFIYANQAGLPDELESYYTLVSNSNWINLPNAILISRALIAKDSMVYVDLWKSAKGMKPPLYQANSIFLRASAEIASGLLKIASKETDLTRKALYQLWATKALDTLATLQIQTGTSKGAFPFPDLRIYNDATFSSIIQNFMFKCGTDSVNVLQNGWIIDDKGIGEFKFDAGVIANAYFEAYQYTGNINYKNIAIAVGNYVKTLNFNLNYNYNSFVALALTRSYQLTSDTSYINRATKNVRYSVYPGQVASGRWVDGHNASSRYHSIILQNIIPLIQILQSNTVYNGALDTMTNLAVKNMIDYSYSCGASTGFRWLLKSYLINSNFSFTLQDSISNLIGYHINQSALNAKFLDIPTIGEYFELLDLVTGIKGVKNTKDVDYVIFPNPTKNKLSLIINSKETQNIFVTITDVLGKIIYEEDLDVKSIKDNTYQMDVSKIENGTYFFNVKTKTQHNAHKIIIEH